MTYAEFKQIPKEYLKGWKQIEFSVSDKPVGLLLNKASEIHILLYDPNRKSLSRKNIRNHLAPILKRYGFIITRFPLADGEPKLMTKLGFKKSWQDASMSYWMLDKLPFAKEPNDKV